MVTLKRAVALAPPVESQPLRQVVPIEVPSAAMPTTLPQVAAISPWGGFGLGDDDGIFFPRV
jgi:hypothetical protein